MEAIQTLEIAKTIYATSLNIPFSPLLKNTNIIVIDAETNEDKQLLVFGYYIFGESVIHQLIFHEARDPKEFARTLYFKMLIAQSNYRIAAYNINWESELFDIPREKMIETMGIPYLKKDDFISIKTIDMVSPKMSASPLDAEKMSKIGFRNLSCIMKTTILVLGMDSFLYHSIKTNYMSQLQNFIRGKFYA